MEIHWYQLLFQIINFAVLIIVLNKFLYKPIITIVNQRYKKIQDSVKAAEETLKQKEKIDQLKKQARQEAEKEAVEIIEKAKLTAASTGRKMLDEAKREAEEEVDKKFLLLNEKLTEQENKIQSRLTDMIIKTTSRVLKDSLTEKDQKQIIDKEIKKLASLKS